MRQVGKDDEYHDSAPPPFVPVEYSFWRPSPVELLRLMRGRPIRICAIHNPISVDTEE